ncbi:MAG: hypothetical protein WAO78_16215 [Roseovarius sp.]
MGSTANFESSEDLAEHVGKIFRFSVTSSGRDAPTFHFGDFPFAVSVFCQRAERGYIADFWVSGRRYQNDHPRLVMRVTTGIDEPEPKHLEGTVNLLWEHQLQEIAFGSAMMGGISLYTHTSWLTKRGRDEMISFHLDAQDRFAKEMGVTKRSKVEQTALWHNLIRSFGIKQTQQLIAQHEWVRDLAEPEISAEEFDEREKHRTSHINQRLQLARRQGLLISIPSTGSSKTTTRRKKEDVTRRD